VGQKTNYTCDGCKLDLGDAYHTIVYPKNGPNRYWCEGCYATACIAVHNGDRDGAEAARVQYLADESAKAVQRATAAEQRADKAERTIKTLESQLAAVRGEAIQADSGREDLRADNGRLRLFLTELVSMLGKKRRRKNAERLQVMAQEAGWRTAFTGAGMHLDDFESPEDRL